MCLNVFKFITYFILYNNNKEKKKLNYLKTKYKQEALHDSLIIKD